MIFIGFKTYSTKWNLYLVQLLGLESKAWQVTDPREESNWVFTGNWYMPGEGQIVFFKVVTLYKSNNLQPMAIYLRVCRQQWDSACLKIKWEHRVRWVQTGCRYRGSKCSNYNRHTLKEIKIFLKISFYIKIMMTVVTEKYFKRSSIDHSKVSHTQLF